MKCDELNDYDYDPNFPFQSRGRFYIADEVEAAIAELKAENERLEKCCKEYDIRQRIDERIKFNGAKKLRATKRALWLARAELCHRLDVDRYLRKHCNSWYNENCLTWNEACVAMEVKMCKAESKCRAKAEEYK